MSTCSMLRYSLPLSLLAALVLAATLNAANVLPQRSLGVVAIPRGIIALPTGKGGNGPTGPTGPLGGPIGRNPGGGVKPGGVFNPNGPLVPVGPLVDMTAGGLTVAPAQLQVLNAMSQWTHERKFVAVQTFHFRWSRMDQKVVSAKWYLAQHQISQPGYPQPPQQPQPPRPHPQQPTAVLIGSGILSLPPIGQKQEFTIDFTKYLPATTQVALSEFRVHVALLDAAGNQIAKSNEATLLRVAPDLQVTGYERFKGNFDANEPPTDAFIRAKITNQGSLKYEGGGKFEFYAKHGNSAPKLIGQGTLPAIDAGQTQTVFAVRPVDDWDKTDATSQYTYECKLVP